MIEAGLFGPTGYLTTYPALHDLVADRVLPGAAVPQGLDPSLKRVQYKMTTAQRNYGVSDGPDDLCVKRFDLTCLGGKGRPGYYDGKRVGLAVVGALQALCRQIVAAHGPVQIGGQAEWVKAVKVMDEYDLEYPPEYYSEENPLDVVVTAEVVYVEILP